tara:strand:- start:3960 stop:4172 length:213 start_codon:yes stop_codon:yes gene_type:complete
MTATEVAASLKISERAVYKMLKEGRLIPPLRRGTKQTRWSRESVTDWIRFGCPSPEGFEVIVKDMEAATK